MPSTTVERRLALVPDTEAGDCQTCGSEPTPGNPVFKAADGERVCRSCLAPSAQPTAPAA